MVDIFDALLIFATILFGVISSFTDIRDGKIRNRHILIFLIVGLLINACAVIWSQKNIMPIIMNIVFGTIVGYLFYAINIWTPGDGKMFMVYNFLVPVNQWTNLNSNILVNTILIAFIYLTVAAIKRGDILNSFKVLSIKLLLNVAISLFSFFWLVDMIFFFLNLQRNFFLSFILSMVLFMATEKIFNRKIMLFKFFLCGLRLIFDTSWMALGFWLSFVWVFGIFLLLRFIIIEMGYLAFTREIEPKRLKEGMILANVVYEDTVKDARFHSVFDFVRNNISTEGLNKDDIKKLRRINKNVRVVETMPFAPFMFIGAALSLVFLFV